MNIESLREYCLSKNGATEGFPFEETTLVFKVMGKMFLLTGLENEFSISVKCDPEKAVELRELYPAVIPGYHLSKKHWNTVFIDESLSDSLIQSFIDHSYQVVVLGLSRKRQMELSKKERNE
jgi:predicted DNA-binding protein (MmcQ/YjbR family)